MAFALDFLDFIAKVQVLCTLRRSVAGIQCSLGRCR